MEKTEAYKILRDAINEWFTAAEEKEKHIDEAFSFFCDAATRAENAEKAIDKYDALMRGLQQDYDSEREAKEKLEKENKILKDLGQKLQVAPVQPEYDYRVIRTYDARSVDRATKDLEDYFKAGYEFVRASEFVRADSSNNYIEYIVRKKRQQV